MDKDFLRQIDDLGALIPPKDEEVLNDDFLICECFCVSARDIRTACESQGKVDLELVQNQLSLGQGCQGCIKRIDSWIEKIF
jgi:NAD(P)H-nitrite reductase large subunit